MAKSPAVLEPETVVLSDANGLIPDEAPTTPEPVDSDVDDEGSLDPGPDGPPVQLIDIPTDDDFATQLAKTGERDYIVSKDLAAAGQLMIRDYPELVHLADFRLVYAWKRRGGEVKGQAQFGSIVRGNTLMRMLAKVDFVVWLAADHARDYVFSPKQRDACLYHQLRHASVDEFGKPFMRGHDLEMYAEEVERFGLWSLDLKQAYPVFQQTGLDMDGFGYEPGEGGE